MTGNFYKKIVEESPLGYAYHKVICDDEGKPVDYIFLEVNESFEKFTGLLGKDIIGKRATEAIPNIVKDDADWIGKYGDVALHNKNYEFDGYSEALEEWYRVTAYAPSKGYFITLFQNFTQHMKKQEAMGEIENKYHSIFDYSPIGITNTSMEGMFIEVNDAFCKMTGYSREELLSMHFLDITYYEDLQVNNEGALNMKKGLISVFHMQKRYVHKSGSIVWADISSTLLRSIDGTPLHFINMVSDITEQKQKEEHKQYIDTLIKEMGRVAKIGGWEFDVISGKWSLTEEVFHILDLPSDFDIEELMDAHYYTEESRHRRSLAKKEAIENGTPYDLELEAVSAKGVKKWIKTIGTPTFKDGKVVKLHGSFQDITERKASELALRKSEEQYRLIAENVADVISVYNKAREKYVYVSPSIKNLRGISVEEAMNESIEDAVSKESFEAFRISIEENLNDFLHNPKTKNYYIIEVQQPCKNGDLIWVETTTKYQYNSEGEIESVNVIRNIEERKKVEKELFDLSYRDQLTGLYNRRFYEEELKRLDAEENLPLALVMLDVNGLKLTNDALGHQAGDLLLTHISRILKNASPKNSVVSRIGGDEFVVLLPNTRDEETKRFISKIHKTLLKEGQANLISSLSAGYAIRDSRQESMDQLFKNAEDEMYRHKLSESSSVRSKPIDLIMNSLYAKNERAMSHSQRVSQISESIASNMSFTQEEIQQIKLAGLVHDIGKIAIGNTILDKPDHLTQKEWDEIKKHSEVGYRILNAVKEFSQIAKYILAHHERWDGTGYPLSLKGKDIPIEARIIAVADAYDAMTTDRPYKENMSVEGAVAEIKRCAGTQFDAEIVEIFVRKVIPSGLII